MLWKLFTEVIVDPIPKNTKGRLKNLSNFKKNPDTMDAHWNMKLLSKAPRANPSGILANSAMLYFDFLNFFPIAVAKQF